jgi:hypothetical protein
MCDSKTLHCPTSAYGTPFICTNFQPNELSNNEGANDQCTSNQCATNKPIVANNLKSQREANNFRASLSTKGY